MTMKLISVTEISGSVSATFSSIPSIYTDLMILCSLRDNGAGAYHNLYLKFNGSAANYSNMHLYGNGSAADWSSSASEYLGNIVTGNSSTANTFSNIQIYVPDYATSKQKPFSYNGVTENNSSAAFFAFGSSLWANTAAINSFTIGNNSDAFSTGSTVSIYGITKGSGGASVA